MKMHDKALSDRLQNPPAICRALLLAAALSIVLGACHSSTPSTPNPEVNQALVHQNLLDNGETVKPYQTVVLNMQSAADDHLSTSATAGYHRLNYEVVNTAKYKLCIPDDNSQLRVLELFDRAGSLVGRWARGEACNPVGLDPGRYTMHVHLDRGNGEPLIFMKPHQVTVTRIGEVPAPSGPAATGRLLNLAVDSLLTILSRNKAANLSEAWGIRTTFPDGNTAYPEIKPVAYTTVNAMPAGSGTALLPEGVPITLNEGSRLTAANLFSLSSQSGDVVTIKQGDNPLVGTMVCLASNGSRCAYMGRLATLHSPQGASKERSGFRFFPQSNPTSFQLSSDTERFAGRMYWETYRGERDRWHDHTTVTLGWAMDSAPNEVTLSVVVRYGTVSGTNLPAMLANEVALFDGAYTDAGFPDRTRYWIVSESLPDFSTLSFDNPANRIRTVIAGRAVRAQVYQNPSYQGDSFYAASPTMQTEALKTGADHALLGSGTVGSIRIEANSNNVPVNEYEHHVILSANTCVGCDLRGFEASFFPSKTFTNANFSYSDLANSKWQNSTLIGGNFSHTNFTGASFAMQIFDSCNFTRTDFSRAVFTSAKFQYSQPAAAENAFYNACPKFENTDLTSNASFFDYRLGFDSHFLTGSGSGYDAQAWWTAQTCRPSIANAKVADNLFLDKRKWQFVDAPGVDFSGMNLDGACFAGSNLTGASFRNASLRNAVFTRANLANVDFTSADLTGAHLEGAKNLPATELYLTKTMSQVYLSGMTLDKANLTGLDMSGARMDGGTYANWDGYTFEAVDPLNMNGAYMYNTKLNNANVNGAFLQSVTWHGDDATGAGGQFEGTSFDHANMPGVKLTNAHFKNASFNDAVLISADFATNASTEYAFSGTKFYQANLKGANFSGVNMYQTSLYGAYVYNGITPPYDGKDQLIATVELLDDPIRNPGRYMFKQVAYAPTVAPASTQGVKSCPNNTVSPTGDCGAITTPYWKSPLPPNEPDNCHMRPAKPGETPDDKGLVIDCDSHRRPTTVTTVESSPPN